MKLKQGHHTDKDYKLYLKSVKFKELTPEEIKLIKKEESKYRDIKRKYGLSKEAYLKLIKKQKGLCAGCQLPPKKLCVDHDHKTGKIRGILCSDCNVALGLLKDNPETLYRLRKYVIRHQ